MKNQMTVNIQKSNLVKGAEFFPVGCEGEEAVGRVHQTSDLQTIIITPLTGVTAFTPPNHEAVTAFNTDTQHIYTLLS